MFVIVFETLSFTFLNGIVKMNDFEEEILFQYFNAKSAQKERSFSAQPISTLGVFMKNKGQQNLWVI